MSTFITQIHQSEREAIVIPASNTSISYKKLGDLIGHFQTFFNSTASPLYGKIPKGARVAISLENNLEFVVSFLTVTNFSRVASPLNPNYKESEIDFYLEDLQASVLIIGQIGKDGRNYTDLLTSAAKRNIPVIQTWYDFNRGRVEYSIIDPKNKEEIFKSVNSIPVYYNNESKFPGIAKPDDVALILHTSGTTGRPKSVPLTHDNISTSMKNISGTYDLTPSDRTYIVMPLFHVHGLIGGLLSTLSTQGTVIIPIRFSAKAFWNDFTKFKATWYTAVPTIHQILLHVDRPNPLPKIRFIRSCSSALAPSTLEDLEKAFKAPVLEAYAMTEASHQMCSNFLPSKGERKPGTVGHGQGVEVVILDDDDNLLKSDEIGEVSIKGNNVTKGYLNNVKANSESFTKNGFFRTGDQGFLDSDGFLKLTGRLKELINRGGEKLSPIEIDSAILRNPYVKEVVAFGADDVKYGQIVKAAVVLTQEGKDKKIGQPELKEYLKDRISSFKIPEQFYFLDAIPKTATGKIQRRNIAKIFSSESKL